MHFLFHDARRGKPVIRSADGRPADSEAGRPWPSADLWPALFRQLSEAVLAVRPGGEILHATPPAFAIFSGSGTPLEGLQVAALVDVSHRGLVTAAIRRAVATPGTVSSLQARSAEGRGARLELLLLFEAVDTPEGPMVVVTVRDSTRRLALTRELADREAQFRMAFDVGSEPMLLIDEGRGVVALNSALRRCLGDGFRGVLGGVLGALIRLRPGESEVDLLDYLSRDDDVAPRSVVRRTVRGLCLPPRVRVRARSATLAESSRRRFCVAFEPIQAKPLPNVGVPRASAPAGDPAPGRVLWVLSPLDRRVVCRTGDFVALLGTQREVGATGEAVWLERVAPEQRDRVARAVGGAYQGDYDIVYAVETASGRRWIRERSMRLEREDTESPLVFGLAEDVSHEAELVGRARLLSTAVERIDEGVMITGTDARIEYVNPAFEEITGFAAGEVLGRDPRMLGSGTHDAEFYEDMWRTLRRGETWRARFVNRRKSGGLYTQDATITPVMADSGEPSHYVSVFGDVSTALSRARQLEHAQRLAVLGQFIGSIAHDFNNLLTVIRGNAEFVAEDLGPAHPSAPDLGEIVKAAERAHGLTRRILSFSRSHVAEPRPIDPVPVVFSVESLVRRLLGEDIELHVDVNADVGWIRADPVQLEQVLMNLAVNARDAMRNGGTLSITLCRYAPDDIAADGAREGVRLQVSDTGQGIPAEVLGHIFEPFFTTKAEGEGTGLGLSTVHDIVRRMAGTIHVDSVPGRGTTFDIRVPSVPRPGRDHTDKQHGESVPSGPGGRILVVEDDDRVRRTIQRALRRRGLEVVEVAAGAPALAVWEEAEGDFDLLICDVGLPDMEGTELVALLKARVPGLKVVLTSGRHVRETPSFYGDAVTFLEKPFAPELLLHTVCSLLGP